MHLLDDQTLIASYEKAISMQLEKEFIQILHDEMKKRKLNPEENELFVQK